MSMLTRVRAGHRSAPPAPEPGTTIAHSIEATRAPSWMALRFGAPPEEGETWVGCARALADPGFFPSWQARLGDWLRERFGESPDRTTSGYLMSWYLHAPGFLAGMLFHTARRVPHLRPADLAFRLADSRPHVDGVALLSEGFACLPDDPAAGTARATVVADERALAALLRARFVDHAARFVTAFAPTPGSVAAPCGPPRRTCSTPPSGTRGGWVATRGPASATPRWCSGARTPTPSPRGRPSTR
ncbi:hypothetical protein [Actinoalloteichus caeruleus]|uniref:Uncharacterized protein n=1 Tax=Actinoalloteichus caeruleus DSM 43889 TaxID=1120930 RepID=A0ABT1JJH9_ACTCY|nr:hypothetical protein [Actinoalloteichus caeruleus]MCP2332667.1 hypothetical protein [Actinoalloteichus caeruleus DSM 43889]